MQLSNTLQICENCSGTIGNGSDDSVDAATAVDDSNDDDDCAGLVNEFKSKIIDLCVARISPSSIIVIVP
ncbi:hypothetical protein DERP_006060 [Dermatophagoides pteronyssinus]|uniref:Uncharacterized protein n=1 Tax=Dermatophagoides pteronyssinus TaxID=6956 RepID=A0ABQ8JS78_DERPT|nr:hypothetical protein DERP_006060 [Dermatophagoides pteronyssinus]